VKDLAIIGAGSWGTALAIVLAPRFDRVRLWPFESDLASRMMTSRENDLYLPGLRIPTNVEISSHLQETVSGADVVVNAVPSQFIRGTLTEALPALSSAAIIVSASKGIENETLSLPSEIITDVVLPKFHPRVAVLSGPTFAREVASENPTAVVVASKDDRVATCLQSEFSGPTFRLYSSPDPVGVQIGGSIKNVVAIGAGVVHSLGLGHNAMAALITRGLAEITRLAVAMGGMAQTLSGLAGLGDLVLTCTGELSRNRAVGMQLANGRNLAEIVGSMRMVAEGVKTTAAALQLAKRHSVEMPITEQMYQMLHLGLPPREAVRRLMERSLRGE
jgi:glycerol-3-phosphate dehydrogenase (NAD(P)+)